MTESPVIPRPDISDCWNKIGVSGDGTCPELKEHVHCRNCPVYTTAATRLLDSSPPPNYLDEWTRYHAQPKTVSDPNTHSFFIFRVGVEWLALPIQLLAEIAPVGPVHSIPHRQGRAVRGLTNIRGQLVLCLSLDIVLGIESTAPGQTTRTQTRFLVIEDEGRPLAFSVDEASGIHSCPARELKEVPSTVARSAVACTTAVLPWNGHSVACLDKKQFLTALNRSLA